MRTVTLLVLIVIMMLLASCQAKEPDPTQIVPTSEGPIQLEFSTEPLSNLKHNNRLKFYWK